MSLLVIWLLSLLIAAVVATDNLLLQWVGLTRAGQIIAVAPLADSVWRNGLERYRYQVQAADGRQYTVNDYWLHPVGAAAVVRLTPDSIASNGQVALDGDYYSPELIWGIIYLMISAGWGWWLVIQWRSGRWPMSHSMMQRLLPWFLR
ncbi:MAG TPA: hypothetical protein VLI05_04330 [Candidatus Saccharimonadia bacterium]|nr:hypothetical protein [Candidatus Saccharimonadia bacterium]